MKNNMMLVTTTILLGTVAAATATMTSTTLDPEATAAPKLVEITQEDIDYIRSVYDAMHPPLEGTKDRQLALRAWREEDIKVQWDECVDIHYTECIAIMEKDFKTHPFRFLVPEVHVPRDEQDFNRTYYKVGISTSLSNNEVTGDKNMGQVCYPFVWNSASEGPMESKCWNCSGLRGDECCLLIEQSMAGNYDTKGNRMQCYIYQDAPTPDTSDLDPQQARHQGYIAKDAPYYIMKYNKDHNVYVKLDMPSEKIEDFRTIHRKKLIINLRTLEEITFETKRCEYDDFETLTRELALNTSPILSAQNLISDLDQFLIQNKGAVSLHLPSESVIGTTLRKMISLIEAFLENREQFFTPIHILTTGKGLVLAPPKLGAKLLQIQKFRPLDPER